MIYIETERLILRDWQLEDLSIFQHMNIDSEVRKFFPDIASFKRSEVVFWHMQHEIDTNGIGLFAVEEKTSQQFIGFIGLQLLEKSNVFNMDIMPCYEIGWRLIRSAWNKGYATEGARAALAYVKERTNLPIYSFAAVGNKASIHVMEKIGLTYVKTFNHPLIDERHPLSRHVLYKEG